MAILQVQQISGLEGELVGVWRVAGLGLFQHGNNPLGTAGGEATTVDAAPDTTVGEFQGLVLRTLRPDDDALTRRVTYVELVLGKKRLLEDTATLAESGVSTDTFSIAAVSKRSVKL